MFKQIFAVLALAFALFGTQCWATTCIGGEGVSCSNTFSSGNTEGVYDFTGTNDGKLVVDFDTVLTTFTLTVTVNHTIDSIDPNEFPTGTVCVKYQFNGSQCDQYDFTGNVGGPNGVPVRNKDYKGLITLTLSYFSNLTVHTPAFGHAPGDITTITEDILTGYSELPIGGDGTMVGKTPGLSSVVALDKPSTQTGTTLCFVSPTELQSFTVGQEIEVTFQLFSGGTCPIGTGTPIRDKTAQFSLVMTDTFGNFISFPPLRDKEEGNKFHWDNKSGVNEFDLSTVGLAAGNYTITVIGSKFSPQSVDIILH